MIADAARAAAVAPSNPIARTHQPCLRARSGVAPAARSAARAGAALLRLGTYALGRLVHAVLRNEGLCSREDYKLHIFGAEIPFPVPELVATTASAAEIALPILLAFGLLTRWAALGLSCMTGIIQLIYPGGWANFHLYWAAMALAILTFGPGAISLDRLIGLDGWARSRRDN